MASFGNLEGRLSFNPSNVELVNILCRLETYLRRYFDLPTDYSLDDMSNLSSSPTEFIVQIVLVNYLYDAYVRLLISGNVSLVTDMHWPGTVSLVWALDRAYQLDPQLLRSSQSIVEFSARLDNLRRSANIDILTSGCLAILDEYKRLQQDHQPRLPLEYRPPTELEEAAELSQVQQTRYPRYHHEDEPQMLTHLKTFYDVERENRLFDHSSHYNDAFVPAYRFCNSHLSELNMSCHIGHTMRENIRSLYDYISAFIGDPHACPCIVIFNLFIRDNYRMYHSKSLRQSSFVSIRKTDGTVVRLSYMIVTNLFPRIGSWFKSINNQLVKKTGKTHILHLDAFVRLLLQLMRSRRNGMSHDKEDLPDSDCAVRRNVRLRNSWRRTKKTRRANPIVRKAATPSATTVVETTAATTALRRRSFRLSLSHLYQVTNDVNILVDLFLTAYVSCKHERLKRTYEQLRSNDESATLVRLCLDCGHRV